jgi:phenylalanyl-tRNA synthetase alpha chain
LKDIVDNLLQEIRSQSSALGSKEDLEQFRNTYLARKGKIAGLFEDMKGLSKEEKPFMGKLLNELRREAESLFQTANESLESSQSSDGDLLDVTLPGRHTAIGHQHIISKTIGDIKDIFRGMGFSVATGPEIETDYYNFESLNFPPDHPARDMQDTFFVTDDVVLRTHTSPVQTRVMENQEPPIRVIMPGKVYRNEEVSARSHMQFHQVEGLYIDTDVTFADLKGTLVSFARQFYGESLKYIFRASSLPSPRLNLTSPATCVPERAAVYANTRDGSKYSVAVWSIRTY